MELSRVYSRACQGVDAPLVTVETHLSGGLPRFSLVGLPETAVRESRERVRSAIINSHFDWPERRITVNLSPADLPKEGRRFDLPIALGILLASEQVGADLSEAGLVDTTILNLSCFVWDASSFFLEDYFQNRCI